MGFQIMQVAMPKKLVERSATGSAYDVVRELPIGGAFFVPCNEGEDLNKCMRRVSASCIRIAQDADIRLSFRSLESDLAVATFGDAAMVPTNDEGNGTDTVYARTAGVGVWRIDGKYNHRARKVSADVGEAEIEL